MAISMPISWPRHLPNARDGGTIFLAATRSTQLQYLRPQGRMGRMINLTTPSGPMRGSQSIVVKQLVVDGISVSSGTITAMIVNWTTESLWVTDGLKGCGTGKTSSSR